MSIGSVYVSPAQIVGSRMPQIESASEVTAGRTSMTRDYLSASDAATSPRQPGRFDLGVSLLGSVRQGAAPVFPAGAGRAEMSLCRAREGILGRQERAACG